jgi:UDP-N-acetylglucosamine 2-epimerase (non-hydrolysing)
MLDQVLEFFSIEPDEDLDLMRPNQTLGGLTARAIEALDKYFSTEKPDLALVQGDTTTVFCATLAAFYHRIPVCHVEAGLRTGNLQSPWPEEANRVLTTRLATLHFAPTGTNRQNLLREGVPDDRIFVTGNTVIDALFLALEKVRRNPPHIAGLPEFLQPSALNHPFGNSGDQSSTPCPATEAIKPQLVLITGHRRENFGKGFEEICRALAELADRFPRVHFVYPVHLNPNVREPVERLLRRGSLREHETRSSRNNLHLIEPLLYPEFVSLMDQATLILTDSGGVQEEAPSLGKPVLVMRETTERPEGVQAGTVMLVGADSTRIVAETARLLTEPQAYASMAQAANPYGDGHASERIAKAVVKAFENVGK